MSALPLETRATKQPGKRRAPIRGVSRAGVPIGTPHTQTPAIRLDRNPSPPAEEQPAPYPPIDSRWLEKVRELDLTSLRVKHVALLLDWSPGTLYALVEQEEHQRQTGYIGRNPNPLPVHRIGPGRRIRFVLDEVWQWFCRERTHA